MVRALCVGVARSRTIAIADTQPRRCDPTQLRGASKKRKINEKMRRVYDLRIGTNCSRKEYRYSRQRRFAPAFFLPNACALLQVASICCWRQPEGAGSLPPPTSHVVVVITLTHRYNAASSVAW